MRLKRDLAVAALAAGGTAVAVRYGRARRRRAARRGAAWYVVTVEADPAELSGTGRPDALAGLSERHEVRISAAPGGRGCEIAVRDADGAARRRLREIKQLLETGEVLRVDDQPEGHRTPVGRVALPVARTLMRRGAR
ncbi:hypothetical protein [Thermoactinospora rubra]|uniref:hypothetical protein n=1 Tax=Thermoactinospora rubra TaxID=1088767 RepID=UPI000A0F6E68|nr:hypothetical protein [Thermoactinospora rubra]